jgi:hypothetical protein
VRDADASCFLQLWVWDTRRDERGPQRVSLRQYVDGRSSSEKCMAQSSRRRASSRNPHGTRKGGQPDTPDIAD